MNEMKPILMVMVLAFASSCATSKLYDGPSLESEKIAVIRTDGKANLSGFDGRDFLFNKERYFELLPGVHVIEVNYILNGRLAKNAFLVEFDAKAGHEYELQGSHSGNRWGLKLVDVTEKKQVGRIIGSNNNFL